MSSGTCWFCLILLAPWSAQAADIAVQVAGIDKPISRIYAATCEKPHFLSKDFLKECLRVASVAATGPNASLVIEDVPAGRFAVMVFHDVNGNGRLDFNAIGVPTEPGGFSGGTQFFPTFEKAAFEVGMESIAINVQLRCLFC